MPTCQLLRMGYFEGPPYSRLFTAVQYKYEIKTFQPEEISSMVSAAARPMRVQQPAVM